MKLIKCLFTCLMMKKGSRFDVITQTAYQMQNIKCEIQKFINYNQIYDHIISINYYYKIKLFQIIFDF